MSDPTPAERYARAREARRHPVAAAFASRQPFDLDPFQVEACQSLEDGRGVLVAAPTGAGKTVVGEFAVHLALRDAAAKAFYTTPLKALSNQKYRDLADVYGADQVGLLTGDVSINGGARVVVMTTEVLRNMLYAESSALTGLRFVVMDEVHYLADRFRGAVWEEVIIHLPDVVRLVCLSATVSNAEEFGDWLQTVRGDTDVVVTETRPVPLEQHVLVHDRLLPLFDRPDGRTRDRVNRELLRLRAGGSASAGSRASGRGRSGRARGGGRRAVPIRGRAPSRAEAVAALAEAALLPAIFFIFSRAGCDAAVRQVCRAGIRLTTPEERRRIRDIIDRHTAGLPEDDVDSLGVDDWRAALLRGVAAHHAGLLPSFKEAVEELFQERLLRVVFATETLSLGVNMPARTVVLEELEKFNGQGRAPVTPGEYTQLTGRAGRRGVDVEGHAVVRWKDGIDPEAVAALASRRTYPLNSSFRPSYNMAVNLIAQVGRGQARRVLESSFAQFQADRSVVDLARRVRDQEQSLAGYAAAMVCERGDFAAYSRLRRELSDRERLVRRDRTAPHDVRAGRERDVRRLRQDLRAHPCHACPDREQHARWGERYWRLARTTQRLRRDIHTRTGTVARRFERVVDVLSDVGYVRVDAAGDTVVTAAGRTMRALYGDRDLLVAECLRAGVWDGLDAAELAAVTSCLVFDGRGADDRARRAPSGGRVGPALERTHVLWARLDDLEHRHGLDGTPPVATDPARAMQTWAHGRTLSAVLEQAGLAPGDFVRWARQTVDLLGQVSAVAPPAVAATARAATTAVRRGMVSPDGA